MPIPPEGDLRFFSAYTCQQKENKEKNVNFNGGWIKSVHKRRKNVTKSKLAS